MTLEERLQHIIGRLVFENAVLAQQLEELKAPHENGSLTANQRDVKTEKIVG